MGEEKQYLRLAKFALEPLNCPPDLYHQKQKWPRLFEQ